MSSGTKTIADFLEALPLSDGDYIPVFQPGAFNPVVQREGDTRRVSAGLLADFINKKLENKVNHIVGEVCIFFRGLTSAELMANRLLKPEFQILPVESYQEFFNAHYCGDANNAAAPWFYRCTSAGSRSITGTHFRNISPEGLFFRVAGKNKVYGVNGKLTPEGNISDPNNPPYDGNSVGYFDGDKSREIEGAFQANGFFDGSGSFSSGVFEVVNAGNATPAIVSGSYLSHQLHFKSSKVVPTGVDFKPASLSINLYMWY